MKLNPKYLIYHDLIGLENVLALRNDEEKRGKEWKNIGTVIDETKNMLITLNNNNKKKMFIKNNHKFRFMLPQNDGEEPIILEVEGRKIVGRPENRIKDIKKRRWLKK